MLGVDDGADLAQEPRVDRARIVDLLVAEAEPHRLRDVKDTVGRGRAERGADRILVIALAEPVDGDLIEPGEPGFQRAQRFLQGLRKGAADRHGFADRFHRGGQDRLGTGKFLEREARNLGDDIIDRGLERGRGRAAGDVVFNFVEGVADGELGCDFGDRKSGGLRRQCRGTRHAWVHLDDDQAAVFRIDRELDVGSAGFYADLAQHRDRGIAHDLIFLVGQGQGRRDGDRIASMHAHRIEVLDRADDDAVVAPVAHHLHLEFLPAEYQFLDQHFGGRRRIKPALDDLEELGLVVGDAAAGSGERE